MDVKIKDRDIVLNSSGGTVYVDDIDEIAQRVLIAANIRKGDFPYNRNLGSNAFSLSASDPLLTEKLEMIIREASLDVPYTDLRVTKTEIENNRIKATVCVYCGEEKRELEVNARADL